MKTKIFKSFKEYESWTERFENCSDYEEIPCVIDNGWKISMDMLTECRSWKTALRRFEKQFKDVDENAGITDWVEGIRESCENGYFKDAMTMYDKEEEKKTAQTFGTYSWGIEDVGENYWYIFLNISGEYAGRSSRA